MPSKRLRVAIFYSVALLPALVLAAALAYLLAFTNALPLAYLKYVRNINFDCFEIVDRPYVYRMKPGVCHFDNAEYSTLQTIDAQGFRNARPAVPYDADTVLLGDSHAYGFSVDDGDTLPAQLKARHGIEVLNLAVPTYATWRELETVRWHAPAVQTLVIQVCENDLGENAEYARFPPEQELELRKDVLQNITAAQQVYQIRHAAQEGWLHALQAVVQVVRAREYRTHHELAAQDRARDLDSEALRFADMLERQQELLRGRRVIVFESASYGRNSPRFRPAFEKVLRERLPWLDLRVLDSSAVLDKGDYFYLDDHPRASAYRKLADLIAPHLKSASPAASATDRGGAKAPAALPSHSPS